MDNVIYPKSWYPLCRSSDVKSGQVLTRIALGKKLVIFRNMDGDVGVMQAQCCHIGADLGEGQVKGKHLICPLHHWAFNVHGECVHIPCQKHIPKNAKQQSLTCEEHFGQLYVYWGKAIDFPFPSLPNIKFPIQSKALTIDFNAPYEMAAVNSFDEQHLAAVHRRRVVGKQEISSTSSNHFKIEYKAIVEGKTFYDLLLQTIGKNKVHMTLDCWGGNILYFKHVGTSNQMLISLLPISEHTSRAFITTILSTNDTAIDRQTKRIFSKILNIFTMLFVKQDVRVLQNIDFKFITLLPEADATMIKFYQHWKQLTRHQP